VERKRPTIASLGPHANTAWAAVSPASATPIYWENEDCSNRRIVVTTVNFLHAINAYTGRVNPFLGRSTQGRPKTGIDGATIAMASPPLAGSSHHLGQR
jgi:hypothetical protein